jgi:putative heme-binding domain-containing protein
MNHNCRPHSFLAQHLSGAVGAFVGVALLFCGWSSAAQSIGKPRPQDQSSAAGRTTFESTCSGCHGLDGRGSERGPDISAKAEVLRLSDTETLRVLRNGIPAAGMPAFGSLGSARLKAVLRYLRKLQGTGGAAAVLGNPQRGQAVFFGKAGCSECHSINGTGGFLGSDLSAYGLTPSAAEIRDAIANPSPEADLRRRTVAVTLRDGRTFSGLARNEDNFSLQLQSPDGTFHLLRKSEAERIEVLPKPLMPTDYGSTLLPAELDDLVSFLMMVGRNGTSRQGTGSRKQKEQDEN